MPTPDLDAYTDLVLYDTDPQDLVDRAMLDVEARFPDTDFQAGDMATVLLEAVALVTAECVYAINRVPSAVIDLQMQFAGAQRSTGTPAVGAVQFTIASGAGGTIPAGTQLAGVSSEGVPFAVTTDTDLIVPAGATTGTVPVTAADPGADPNGVPAGTHLDLASPSLLVDDVAVATALSAGTDPESDQDWMTRAVARIARFTDLYVLPRHFTTAALDQPGVTRALTVDAWDPTANSGAGGTVGGHVTVVLAGPGGTTVAATVKAATLADLDGHASADLAVHVVDATVTTMNVALTVKALPGAATADVQAAVTAQVRALLDPDAWAWGGVVHRNELIAAASRAAGVDYVVTVATPAADQSLPGLGPLARAGTVAVTVNLP